MKPSFELVPAAMVPVAETRGLRVRQLLGMGSRPRAPKAAFGEVSLCDFEFARGAAYAAAVGSEGALYVIEGTLEVEGQVAG